ncbi:MAG: SRPBCC family protein [Candidatus Handelsmanbacteria bacterium]|nr:SRPBCC family protein [Candidatus Handelsmanbacteria bacterium]
MAFHVLDQTQRLALAPAAAWRFFTDPANLALITPPYLGFVITGGAEQPVYAGQIITYKVSPLLGIPLTWMTEITQVREGAYFIDEQRLGPYALWHHQHHFRAVTGGVEMRDLVHYRLRGGPWGRLVHRLAVRRQLEGIFRFRRQVLAQRFGELPY